MCNDITQYHAPNELINLGFWGRININDNILLKFVAPLLIFINSIILNTVFNRNDFMERNNFLIAILYICFSSFFHSFYYLDGFAIAQTLLIITLYQLLKLSQNEDGRRPVFNASFLLGLACTVYPLLLIGIIFLFWMVWVVRPFLLRESMLVITGFILPLLYVGTYNYIFKTQFDKSEFSSTYMENHVLDLVILGSGMLLLFIACLKNLLNKIGASTIRLKKLFRILLLLTVLTAGVGIIEIFGLKKSESLSLIFIPFMFFLPYAFGTKEQKTIPTLIFYLIFFYSVGKFFIPFEFFTL